MKLEKFQLCPCTTDNQSVTTFKCGCQGAETTDENKDLYLAVEQSDVISPEAENLMHEKPKTEEKREEWSHPIEFLFSCISMSVGLGNVWRFPFVAYKCGGGAFLIPYIIVQFLVGKPLYFLELAIGQFSSSGPIKIWKMVPLFKGVGYGSSFVSVCVMSYYCSIMATSIFYFFASFQSPLPWTVCNNQWTDVICNHSLHENATSNSSSTAFQLQINHFNTTQFLNASIGKESNIPELYYKKEVLQEKERIDDGIGIPEWRLTLCLIGFWTIIFLSMIKGVRSSGKISFFTALFPYFVLFILLAKALTLEGSVEGILYFITPQWEKLLEAQVWYAAIEQCFFSLSVGFGPVIMYASYNPFRHNVYRDAMILSTMDTLTSMLAGCTVFAILGYLAHDTGVDISQVSRGGTALAFESYPTVISKLEWAPQFFAVLFFLMLLTLGVGSTISGVASLVTVVHDQFPRFKKPLITAFFCTTGFISGLIYVTPGGQWMIELVDYFGCGLIIVITATLEVVGIVWIYGRQNIVRDIEFMLQRKISAYWQICWTFVVPIGVSIILLGKLLSHSNPTHNDMEFPQAAIISGWLLCGLGLSIIPICAIHSICTRNSKGIFSKIKESLQPSICWGPRDSQLRREWNQISQERFNENSRKSSPFGAKGFLRKLFLPAFFIPVNSNVNYYDDGEFQKNTSIKLDKHSPEEFFTVI